jgi:multicomponent Na+:H+ antiporter subunit E
MTTYGIPVVTIALVWMVVTGRFGIESFAVGLVLGFALVLLSPLRLPRIRYARVPSQLVALLMYLLTLARDIIRSGADVARRVLSPQMPLRPGIIAVDTQDQTRSPLITAMSADVITLTPGELVVDIEQNHILYVHCLDVEASLASADRQQAARLRLFNRILGRGE